MLKLESTDFTPEILFNKKQSIFKIKGMSVSENSYEFYKPAIKWLEKYKINPNEKTQFNIDLKYFNSSSAYSISELLKILKDIQLLGNEVLVNWYYEEDDIEILDYGEELQSIFDIPFVYIISD